MKSQCAETSKGGCESTMRYLDINARRKRRVVSNAPQSCRGIAGMAIYYCLHTDTMRALTIYFTHDAVHRDAPPTIQLQTNADKTRLFSLSLLCHQIYPMLGKCTWKVAPLSSIEPALFLLRKLSFSIYNNSGKGVAIMTNTSILLVQYFNGSPRQKLLLKSKVVGSRKLMVS